MIIKKTTIYAAIIVILLALLIWSITASGKLVITKGATGAAVADGQEVMLYLMPPNCQNCDVEMVKDLTKDINMPIISYEADFIRSALLMFPKDNAMQLLDVKDKKSAADSLCTATADEELCNLAKTLVCEGVTKLDKPNFKLFYMSYCPYGQSAFKSVAQVAKLFGDNVEIEPHFVIYENYQGGGDDYCIDDGKICSMHGIPELNEDVREACVYKYDKDKFWDYTLCVMNSCSLQDVDTCWETCADQYSIDKDKIETCLEEEAVEIMTAERLLNTKYGATGSPTIILNEESYTGGRSAEEMKQGICCGFKTPPSECGEELAQATAAPSGSCS